ncbi:predicted protein [Micromonas commoda]|uniref:Uncharacterized protein n=1 Tax=Micromonas commoda (strain RCC299 / NOUM17 / CCMP2709) TaxID=296587 RepID=C1E4I2_MICCC|nr:predicted protein [Micromonas commoda]ACO62725.1 predicted protein [Micromonas commoda]|eukprot:XP_002501467.1 predicted protein [Micromonas commoda]
MDPATPTAAGHLARLEAELRAKEAAVAEREGALAVREHELDSMLDAQAATRAESENAAAAIARVQAANVALAASLDRRTKELDDREFALSAREARTGATTVAARERDVEKLESETRARDDASAERERAADERERLLQELTALMRERELACAAREEQLATHEAALRDAAAEDRSMLNQSLIANDASENDNAGDLALAQGALERRAAVVEERERAAAAFLEEIRDLHAAVRDREADASERESALTRLGDAIEQRREGIEAAERRRADALDAMQASLSAREREVERREAEAEAGGGVAARGAAANDDRPTPPRSPNKKVNFAAVAAAAADDVIKNVEGGGDAATDADVDEEKDEEMAKMAKTCEVLVMKCELLELEKRSIEEKLGHVTQVASTASALVQKLDEALESHDAVLAETRAERDELRAALESTDRDVAASPRAANGGGGEDGALFRTLVARSEALEAGLFDLERRAAAAHASSARDRASLESALARQRQLESEKRQLESAAKALRAENAALASAPPPTKSRVSVQLAKELESAKAEIASLRLALIAADRKAKAAEDAAKNAVERIRKSASQGAAKFGRREAERLAEKELARARRDATRAEELLAMAKISHEAELGDMARNAATARGVEGVWVKLADAARHECDANKAALARTEAELATVRREGRAMCAAAFSAMAAAAETRDRLDFRTAALASAVSAIEAATVRMCPDPSRDVSRDAHAGSSGDPLDLDAVADALSAPVEALGTLEELALAAAAKYAGDGREDGGEVEVGKLEAKACAAVGGMIDAARGIAAAAATSRAMHERLAAPLDDVAGTPPTTTATAATSPIAAFDQPSTATSPFAAFDRAEETTTIHPARSPPTPPSPVVRVTPPPPDPPWARDRLPTRGRGYPASRVDAATAREESLTASVERATTPAMARLSAIEASLSSRRMSMMERIKMFDKG